MNVPVITLDGPGGVGKGTLSVLLAQHLGWHILDSGALYRVLAYAAAQKQIALDDEAALVNLTAAMDLKFCAEIDECSGLPEPTRVLLDGKDITQAVRSEETGAAASQVATLPGVRAALLDYQRKFLKPAGLVADGRDMGTVVFPSATYKFFLSASPEERAQRRYKQLKQKGINVKLSDLAKSLAERDARDSERATAPLQAAGDAVTIDTTALSIQAVFKQILAYVTKEVA